MPRPPKAKRPGRPRASSSPEPARRSPSASNLSALIAQLNDYRPIEWIRTGIPAIDLIIGGGIPRGRFVEVVGDAATAKSALAYSVIGAFQRAGGQCILLDSEAKTDRSFAEKLGVDWSKLGYSKASSIKECIQIIGRVAQMADPATPSLVVWDSIAATPGSEELEVAVSDKEFKSERAARARELSASFRAFMNAFQRQGATLFGINQLRTNFNFMGYTTLEAPGGRAIKYSAAVRLMMKQRGKIRHKERDIIVGSAITCECIKNTVAPPFRKAELRFKFDSGFVPYSGLDELLLRHGRLGQKAGWLMYKDKNFRPGDIEKIVTEVPELIEPLQGIVESIPNEESDVAPNDSGEGAEIAAEE